MKKWMSLLMSVISFLGVSVTHAAEATFLSPDCRDCAAAVSADGARVGNQIGVHNAISGAQTLPLVTPAGSGGGAGDRPAPAATGR
ncbi:hypothetical protein [Pseudobdellovibrio exovorus]|uniref:Uncharacterized protein n=1 Tax=Pseudobdellovibrio exovorus JSS TaxID=1184267 RepID=M4VB30_9BACT|nr:hypothetical protein [Pseudobdellovibrio exovorus]AGH96423.1 hypothetical protein A11Q_2207 [Pseudobdellovibrio exovorus JSS]